MCGRLGSEMRSHLDKLERKRNHALYLILSRGLYSSDETTSCHRPVVLFALSASTLSDYTVTHVHSNSLHDHRERAARLVALPDGFVGTFW